MSVHDQREPRPRIAFVNQAIDKILPPYSNSVGACTYGLASSLARMADVTVYGRRGDDANQDVADEEWHRGVRYRFEDAPKVDRGIARYYPKVAPYLRALNHRMVPPFSSSPALYPAYTRSVAHAVQRADFDVVHIQHSTQFVRPLKAKGKNTLVVLQLQAELLPQNNLRAAGHRLAAADLVLGLTDYVTRNTQRDLPAIAERCFTLYDGVIPEDFPEAKVHGRGTGPLTIMFAGSISPHKGVHVLVRAFEMLADAHPDAVLEIVGAVHTYPLAETWPENDHELVARIAPLYQTDYMTQLRALVPPALRDRVRFVGTVPRDELVRRYAEADVFAFSPIWDEGQGLTPIEAMAAGVPVVASRSGGVVETVVDGETGFLVAKDDPKGLADAISRLLDDAGMRATMGAAARRRALGQFTWDAIAERAMELYAMGRAAKQLRVAVEKLAAVQHLVARKTSDGS